MRKGRYASAFSLVEVTLALGLAGFCLLALFGLLPIGISSNRASVTESGAANVATGIAADLLATKVDSPPTTQISPQFKISIPTAGSATHTIFFRADGGDSGAVDSDANATLNPFYRATLYFNSDKAQNGAAMYVRILVTWPAMADAKTGTPPARFEGSFETVLGLNRN